MTNAITWERLTALIADASFQSTGDTFEKQYGASFSEIFPSLEEFWKYFVVPATRRIETPMPAAGDHIRLRNDVGQRIQDLAALNHSVFANLIDVQEDIQSGKRCVLEDALFHLGTCCDLAEEFLLTSYLFVLECTGSPSPTLQSLSKDAFLEIAAKWYETAYPGLAEHYFAKGKGIPIHIPNTRHILADYLAALPAWKEYLRASQEIRTYRNVMTHMPRIARGFDEQGIMWVPRIDLITKYKVWAKVENALNDLHGSHGDFVPDCAFGDRRDRKAQPDSECALGASACGLEGTSRGKERSSIASTRAQHPDALILILPKRAFALCCFPYTR